MDATPPRPEWTRRLFLDHASKLPAALATGAAIGGAAAPAQAQSDPARGRETDLHELGRGPARRLAAFQVRYDAARQQASDARVSHPTNGDEERHPYKLGSFTKGLPHNERGEVDRGAYRSLVAALAAGETHLLEVVPMGAADPALQRRFVNPQASLAFDLQGRDSHQLSIPAPPPFASAEIAAEAIELYWQALMRDLPFSQYENTATSHLAASDLSRLNEFHGPRTRNLVTPATLFRGSTPGDLAGPYVSQFLLQGAPFGSQYVEQRMRCLRSGREYMTDFNEWLAIQNGETPRRANEFDTERRYILNGRDLAQWVHIDVLYQAYFNAALILSTPPNPNDEPTGGGMGAPMNPGNPYLASRTQDGFATFGAPHVMALVAEVSTRALKAVWFQKWQVHRRLRPEAFGGAIHQTATGAGDYPIFRDALFSSPAIEDVFRRHGSYLLPQAYPEGSPLHPSYGAGHATVAGACVTVLKAFFDESYVIPNPVMPSLDGKRLEAYRGPDADRLTVGGELNKLAANIAIGRNFAGIHWRSDYIESVKLGETVAISVLEDHKLTYNEPLGTFPFSKFDGTTYEL